MNAIRALTGWPVIRAELPSLSGVPHVAAILAAYLVLGLEPAIGGLMLAIVVSAVLFKPLLPLALNNWQPVPAYVHDPEPTPRAKVILFGLWAATAWTGAAVTALAG